MDFDKLQLVLLMVVYDDDLYFLDICLDVENDYVIVEEFFVFLGEKWEC